MSMWKSLYICEYVLVLSTRQLYRTGLVERSPHHTRRARSENAHTNFAGTHTHSHTQSRDARRCGSTENIHTHTHRHTTASKKHANTHAYSRARTKHSRGHVTSAAAAAAAEMCIWSYIICAGRVFQFSFSFVSMRKLTHAHTRTLAHRATSVRTRLTHTHARNTHALHTRFTRNDYRDFGLVSPNTHTHRHWPATTTTTVVATLK